MGEPQSGLPTKRARLAIAGGRCQKPNPFSSQLRPGTRMTAASQPLPLSLNVSTPLIGTVRVPGDKSISHRALMLGALAVGESVLEGLLEGEDVLATAAAMRAMGATAERTGDGLGRGDGVGARESVVQGRSV